MKQTLLILFLLLFTATPSLAYDDDFSLAMKAFNAYNYMLVGQTPPKSTQPNLPPKQTQQVQYYSGLPESYNTPSQQTQNYQYQQPQQVQQPVQYYPQIQQVQNYPQQSQQKTPTETITNTMGNLQGAVGSISSTAYELANFINMFNSFKR